MTAIASVAKVSAGIVLGLRVMISLAGSSRICPLFSKPRRKSPSVIIPDELAFSSVTPVTPRRFEVISKSASLYTSGLY